MKRFTREDEAPISSIVDLLLHSAVDENASDIHIEPQEQDSLVRFRIDGILHDVLHFSRVMHSQVVSRIKVLANLRTDEHLAPQDGKIRIKHDEQSVDIRISIIPMVEGEKVVMRLLVSQFRLFSFGDLGMDESAIAKVNNALHRSYGMILSTGPTGSGKTTSIYAMLKILNVREKNITTIEDPVEYRIRGVNQIQVNTKTNLTFASGLRSILRQDPNIIFVGEIRDAETAGIAINAALTGHLVVSTLHTNDAATSLPRLIDMHVEPFLVASSVSLIVAQRLVRKICDYCRVSTTITEAELKKSLPAEVISKHYIPIGENKEIRVYKGQGCKNCRFTGYAGRVGVFEVLEVTKEVRRLITERKDSDVIYQQALKEGMLSMLDDGLIKVSKGVTTIEEILRVTRVESL
jgi:type II secretory ATPase GspE/PulE/Tfp pilus assembly ATPase PilB-like protein